MASKTRQGRVKTRILTLRASPEEVRQIKANAQASGLTVSAYLNARGLARGPLRRPRRRTAPGGPFAAAIAQLAMQLGRIGNNINQIARHLNADQLALAFGADIPAKLTNLEVLLSEIRQLLADIDRRIREGDTT